MQKIKIVTPDEATFWLHADVQDTRIRRHAIKVAFAPEIGRLLSTLEAMAPPTRAHGLIQTLS
jgi:hypothetical protein